MAAALAVFILVLMIGAPIALVMVFSGLAGAVSIGGVEFLEIIGGDRALLERRDLRDRLIGLIGYGQLATTTKAFDEAGTRVSRQLLMQSLVSLLYVLAVLGGLYFLDVPYPLVWATRWYFTAGFNTMPFDSSSTMPRWISCQGVWLSGYL